LTSTESYVCDFAAVCCALLMQIFDGADVNLDELDPASDEYLLDETDGSYLLLFILSAVV